MVAGGEGAVFADGEFEIGGVVDGEAVLFGEDKSVLKCRLRRSIVDDQREFFQKFQGELSFC